jgi:hypothetical protein
MDTFSVYQYHGKGRPDSTGLFENFERDEPSRHLLEIGWIAFAFPTIGVMKPVEVTVDGIRLPDDCDSNVIVVPGGIVDLRRFGCITAYGTPRHPDLSQVVRTDNHKLHSDVRRALKAIGIVVPEFLNCCRKLELDLLLSVVGCLLHRIRLLHGIAEDLTGVESGILFLSQARDDCHLAVRYVQFAFGGVPGDDAANLIHPAIGGDYGEALLVKHNSRGGKATLRGQQNREQARHTFRNTFRRHSAAPPPDFPPRTPDDAKRKQRSRSFV